jgi:hypothetical protein
MEKVINAAELDKYPILGVKKKGIYTSLLFTEENVKGLQFMSVHSEI